jgi:Motility quorum-sensing regulator, toxin of MqsA
LPKKAPFYCLDQVRSAAAAGKLAYGTLRMQTDAVELGYSREAVLNILKNLDAKQFYKNYPDGNFQLDAYKVNSLNNKQQRDELYIKFALRGQGNSLVLLVSFHLNR